MKGRAAIVALAFAAWGCAEPASAPGHPAIEATYRARCGSCHVRVEPGARTRAVFESAMARHHDRVRLTAEQWRQMVDFLSPPPLPAASASGTP